jgi:hypothetical protein
MTELLFGNNGYFLRILPSCPCKEFGFSHRLDLAVPLINNSGTISGMEI